MHSAVFLFIAMMGLHMINKGISVFCLKIFMGKYSKFAHQELLRLESSGLINNATANKKAFQKSYFKIC